MPPGIQKLDKELQRKFARGVNYNMKVVIKGDNKVGKTSLFLRLKGYGFQAQYNPTETLNVTSIDWSYKATDDVVKIDLWETVDSASKKNVNFVDLKLENNNIDESSKNSSVNDVHQTIDNSTIPSSKVIITSTELYPRSNGSNNHNVTSPIPESARQSLAELSENFDVYKGANAVLLMMDMTKTWTFKYVQNELPRIPKHIPVLVIANHRDQGHHRTISPIQVKTFLDSQTREPGDGVLMYTETSMKNGFGMRLIEKFFNIPFLKLQEESLIKQLELNRKEGLTTNEELQLLQESIDREYEQYLELETIRRRQQADAMSPVNSGLRQLDETTRENIRNTNMSSDILDKRSSNVTSIESEPTKKLNAHTAATTNFVNDRLPSIVIGAKSPLPEMKTMQINNPSPASNVEQTLNGIENREKSELSDEGDDSIDEDETPRANPLVANYQSDVDSDDQAN